MTRHPDPLGPALAITAGVVFWLNGFNGVLSRDLALYAYAGQQVADGVPPYVGVMNRSGPLAHLVPGAGAWLGNLVGVDDLLAIRVTMLAISTVVVWLTYVLTRDVFGSRLVGTTASLFVATIPVVVLYASGGPRDKTIMMLLLTAALVATVRGRWGWAGIWLALATLTWQPAFLPGGATVLVAALLMTGGRRGALVRVSLAGTVTTLAFVLWFVAVGALPDALDGFIRIHLTDTYQPGFGNDPDATWTSLREAYGIATYLVAAGLLLLPAVAVPAVVRLARRTTSPQGRARDVALVSTTVGEVVGLVWSYRTFNGFADALVLVPFAALGLAAVTDVLVRRLPRRAGSLVAVAACLALLTGGVRYALRHPDPLLLEQRAEVAAVVEVLPEATMLSIEAPQPLVLAHRTNPSPHQMFRLGLEKYIDRTWPGGLAGYAAWISETRPTIVAVGRSARYEWLLPTLEADYVPFGKSPGGWYWYVDRDTAPETVKRLRESVRG